MKKISFLFSAFLLFFGCKSFDLPFKESNNQKVFRVSSFKEFVDALGNNRKIILEKDIHLKEELKYVVLDTSKLKDVSKTKNDGWIIPSYVNDFYEIYGSYSSSVDTRESLSKNNFKDFIEDHTVLVIKNAENLTITSDNSVNIIMNQSIDEVIRFDSVSNLKLENLSIYHKPETDGGCGEYAPVITFWDSKNIIVDNCKLNGSGTEGIDTYKVQNITIHKSEIFNCNKRGLSFTKTNNIQLINSVIYNNKLDADGIYENPSSIFHIKSGSDLKVIGSKIYNNTTKFQSPFVEIDDKSKIQFIKTKAFDNQNFFYREEDAIKLNLKNVPFKKDTIIEEEGY